MADKSAARSWRANRTAMLEDISIEVSSHDVSVVDRLRGLYPAGTRVFVTFVPGSAYRETVDVAIAVQRAGFRAVPHLAARSLKSADELHDFVARITGEAGIDHLLLIGGDTAAPAGPFAASLDVLRQADLFGHGIRTIALAGHPEGHAAMKGPQAVAVLRDKVNVAQTTGLIPIIVTQFTFEAQPIVDWLGAVRDAGVAVPVRVGLAGPASIATLMKFAVRCGVGNSLRALSKRPQSFGRLLTDNTPDDLIEALSGALAKADLPLPGLHIFPFGGVVKAGKWLAALREQG